LAIVGTKCHRGCCRDASPSSQTVSSKWELSWPWYLASTRSYIAAKIDARGSGFQGVKMRSEIQRRIGSIEVQDQLAVLTYLRDTFKFIDRTKICAVGTGYGGYVATMMLLQDFHQVINCSVSISPITNWKYYSKLVRKQILFNHDSFSRFLLYGEVPGGSFQAPPRVRQRRFDHESW
jgi:dipeptidyl aminopeptidase/acylaminoacyl peptidase